MGVSYNKLWKLLVDKKMSKADLRKVSKVSPNTMTKLRRDEEVTLTVLGKICKTLCGLWRHFELCTRRGRKSQGGVNLVA